MGNVRYISEIAGEFKASTAVKLHGFYAMLKTNVANQTYNFTSENTCQAEYLPKLR